MATHDYVIANGTGAAVRSDLNNALAAIVSNNSGSSEPGTTYAYQWWADTNANVLKIRNSANNAWITLRELDGTMLIEDGSASTPGLAFADDTNTGIFSSAADQISFATGGTERLDIGSSEVVFNDPSNDVDFRVESNGETHMLFVDAGNDRVGINVSAPKKDLHVDNTALLTGSAPQIRLSTDANDASDDNRAMFGLCTSAGNFFGGSAVGDTVVRTTNGGNLLFGEGTTERLRLLSAGGLTFNGDTAAANALDDYEDGTYIPTITLGSGSATLNTSFDRLGYTKIGRVVHVQGQLVIDTVSSPSGAIRISLPFTTASLSDRADYPHQNIYAFYNGSGAPSSGLYLNRALVDQNSSDAQIRPIIGFGSEESSPGDYLASGTDIWFVITYFAA